MLIVDDILMFPFKGLWWVFREIADTVEQQRENELDRHKAKLRELYMQLETGQLTEAEFDEQEDELLDRIEELEAAAEAAPA